jgi:membrane protein implicated in regulation of membrane protease activity
VTSDQILPSAIAVVIVVLIVVGLVRVFQRRRGANEDAFGAGGVSTIAIGTRGVAKTDLAPSGVVRVVSEEWTARSANGSIIAEGTAVRVVSQDGLTLVVEPEHAGQPATGGT